MKVLTGGRGSGITTAMLLSASNNDATILVLNEFSADILRDKCKSMHLHIPDIITIDKLSSADLHNKRLYIDNADVIIKYLTGQDVNLDMICVSLE